MLYNYFENHSLSYFYRSSAHESCTARKKIPEKKNVFKITEKKPTTNQL